jgi:2-keto-4-pentenoate hydratase
MTRLQEIAIRQLADYDRHQPGSCFLQPEFRLTVQEAYEIQNLVARLRQQRGEVLAGYKVGCVSETMQRQLSLDRPVFGYVWEGELHADGVAIASGRFDGLAIEGELAIRLAEDVPSAEWLRQNPDVLSEACVVIELHNYVFRGAPRQAAAELIANNAIHAGVVMPEIAAPTCHSASALNATVRVSKNGEPLGEESVQSIRGGPLASVARLAEHLGRWDLALRRGQLVLTGSPLPLWRVAPGDRIEVECKQLQQRVSSTIE